MKSGRKAAALTTLFFASLATNSMAGITVQNPSFESPFVDPNGLGVELIVDHWITAGPFPQPWTDGMTHNAGTGIFPNPDTAHPATHFDNADGNQLAYIFSNSTDEYSQALTDTFAAGKAYSITVGVGNAGSPPPATDSLLLALFYTDAGGRHFVAQTTVMNDAAHALSGTHLNDFTGVSGILAANDPAVGKQINVLLAATGVGGGEFDMDNVRVDVPEPAWLSIFGVFGAGLLRRRRAIARHPSQALL
jgi:hypothetical protein